MLILLDFFMLLFINTGQIFFLRYLDLAITIALSAAWASDFKMIPEKQVIDKFILNYLEFRRKIDEYQPEIDFKKIKSKIFKFILHFILNHSLLNIILGCEVQRSFNDKKLDFDR